MQCDPQHTSPNQLGTSVEQPRCGFPSPVAPPSEYQSNMRNTPPPPYNNNDLSNNHLNEGFVHQLNPSSLNNGEEHFHNNNPFPQFIVDPWRPWWMWTIAIIDVLAALFWGCHIHLNVASSGSPRVYLKAWEYFIIYITLSVQFTKGILLLHGLKSTKIETLRWRCEGWMLLTYAVFFGEAAFFWKLGLTNIIVRSLFVACVLSILQFSYQLFSFLMVRRFRKMVERAIKENEEAKEKYRLQLGLPQCHQSNAIGMNSQQQQSMAQFGGEGTDLNRDNFYYYAPVAAYSCV